MTAGRSKRNEPDRVSPLYDEDLAHVHAVGFGAMAEAAAPAILELLESRRIRSGTIGDVGCGAGITTRAFLEAGYQVWALEPSPALLERARAAAPGASFLPPRSVYDSELPPADAIVAIGEPLSYHQPGTDPEGRLSGLFAAAARALPNGGLLVFDLIVRGEPSLAGRTWAAGDDWAVLVETREDPETGWLSREIVTFRRAGASWRRGREIHPVRIFDEAVLRAALEESGFAVQTADRYGTFPLATRRVAFICQRSGRRSRPVAHPPAGARRLQAS